MQSEKVPPPRTAAPLLEPDLNLQSIQPPNTPGPPSHIWLTSSIFGKEWWLCLWRRKIVFDWLWMLVAARAYHWASCAGWANDENMDHFLNSIHCLFIKSLPTYEWSPEWQLGWPPRWGVEACAGRGLPTFSSKSSGVGGTSATPASLETPPNALVTHLMTMASLLLGPNLEFVILHPFQIWELQNMPFILFVDFGI